MKTFFISAFIALALQTFGQSMDFLDGRWCFTGSRTSIFIASNNNLYFGLLEEADSENFKKFYLTGELDSSVKMFPVRVDSANGKFFLNTRITTHRGEKDFFFIYNRKTDTILHFVGDVYYGDSRVKNANKNCNPDIPACSSYFYHREDMVGFSKLKDLSKLTSTDAFAVLTQFSNVLKNKCNKCYEGFPGADFNRILIKMGFNPVYQQNFNDKMVYSTSGIDYIITNLVGDYDHPKDPKLLAYCNKILNEFWGR